MAVSPSPSALGNQLRILSDALTPSTLAQTSCYGLTNSFHTQLLVHIFVSISEWTNLLEVIYVCATFVPEYRTEMSSRNTDPSAE